MNREQKLSLIIGFTVILLVGVLISDHLSGARTADISGVGPEETGLFDTQLASADVAPFELEEPEPTLGTPGTPPEIMEPVGPVAVIDQSAGEHRDLLDEIASRGGEIVEHGADLLLTLKPDAAMVRTQPTSVRHTVAANETLWEIAERYYGSGSKWKSIVAHNEISDPGAIRAGMRLEIPSPTRSVATPPAAPAESPAGTETTIADRTYTVRKNDTIGEISMALLGTSRRWREIVDLNSDSITDEHVVRVGQVLKIPAR